MSRRVSLDVSRDFLYSNTSLTDLLILTKMWPAILGGWSTNNEICVEYVWLKLRILLSPPHVGQQHFLFEH